MLKGKHIAHWLIPRDFYTVSTCGVSFILHLSSCQYHRFLKTFHILLKQFYSHVSGLIMKLLTLFFSKVVDFCHCISIAIFCPPSLCVTGAANPPWGHRLHMLWGLTLLQYLPHKHPYGRKLKEISCAAGCESPYQNMSAAKVRMSW